MFDPVDGVVRRSRGRVQVGREVRGEMTGPGLPGGDLVQLGTSQ